LIVSFPGVEDMHPEEKTKMLRNEQGGRDGDKERERKGEREKRGGWDGGIPLDNDSRGRLFDTYVPFVLYRLRVYS
jgi:hypothetical protein